MGDRCTWCGAAVERRRRLPRLRARRRPPRHLLPARARRPVGDPRRLVGAPADAGSTTRDLEHVLVVRATGSRRRTSLLVRSRGEHRIPDGFCSRRATCSSGRRRRPLAHLIDARVTNARRWGITRRRCSTTATTRPSEANLLLPAVGRIVRRVRDARRKLAVEGFDSDFSSQAELTGGAWPGPEHARASVEVALGFDRLEQARRRRPRPRARARRLPGPDRRRARSTSAGCSTSPRSATGTASRPASRGRRPL